MLFRSQKVPPTSCTPAASAHGSPPNNTTTAVRLRHTPLANVGTSYLPLTHRRSPTCVQTSLASWHIQTPVTQVLHHFLHELRFEPRPCPAPKCKVRKRANLVSVKTRCISCRHGVLRPSIHHRSTQATIPPSTYCRICYNPSHLNV